MLVRAHILDVERATPRSLWLRVALDAPFHYQAGQAVLVGSASSEARRPYSVANGPHRSARDGRVELLVGLGEDGTPGPHLPVVDAGIPLILEGPFGSFVYPQDIRDGAVLFVAGGTGIAPLRAMLQELLDEGAAARASLLYSARTPDEFAFDGELRALASAGRLRYHRTATREADATWHGDRGRISRAQLESLVEGPETLCFVCGPAALVHEVPRMLREIGVPLDRIRVEEWAVPRSSSG
jgi:sulfhydrogenase subunit gamma (sulfur reductase)